MTATRQEPQIIQVTDALGNPAIVTGRNSLRTNDSQRLIGVNFVGTVLDPSFTSTIANAGAVVLANTGSASIQSGANAAGAAAVESVSAAEFLSGSINQYAAGVLLGNTGVANNVRRWGAFDANNGLFFQLSGTTFSIVSRKNAVDTALSGGAFVGDYGAAGPTLDTSFHVYEIYYSGGSALFLFDGLLVHKLSATAATYLAQVNLKIRAESTNTGSVTNSTVELRGVAISRLGHLPGTAANPLSIINVGVPAGALSGLSVGTRVLAGGTVGTINAIRATTYNEQTANAQRSLASLSASDSAAGVGARQVKVIYYDATMAGPFTETVTMNGVTAVAMVNSNICFIEKMEVVSVGSTGWNVGTIKLFVNNAGAGGTIGTIGVANVIAGQGDNLTFWAHHYVAVGKVATLATFVTGSSSSNVSGRYFLRTRNPLVAASPNAQISDFIASGPGAAVTRVLNIPIKVVGPAVVLAFGIPDANGAKMFASFDFSEMTVL